MDILNSFISFLKGEKEDPRVEQPRQPLMTGQPITREYMQSYTPQTRRLAEAYNQNPQDDRMLGVDPKIFGYEPDAESNDLQPSGGRSNNMYQLRRPNSSITGAIDPRLQVMRGQTPWSPGEGPRTNF